MNRLLILILSFLTTPSAIAVQPKTPAMPPKIIYHAGQKEYLMQDIAAHTVPQDVWDHFIMGDATAYDLPKVRRGLYGAEDISLTSLYGSNAIEADKKNWVMGIVIKDSCRTPETVDYEFDFSVFGKNRFSKWMKTNNVLYSDLGRKCIEDFSYDDARAPSKNPAPDLHWKAGPGYFLKKQSADEVERVNACDETILAFYKETGLKVITDDEFDESWYIRDSDCIEDIQGTPNDLFKWVFVDRIETISGHDDDELVPYASVFLMIQMLGEPELSMLDDQGAAHMKAFEDSLLHDIKEDDAKSKYGIDSVNFDNTQIAAMMVARHGNACIKQGKAALFKERMHALSETLYGMPNSKSTSEKWDAALRATMTQLSQDCGGKLDPI